MLGSDIGDWDFNWIGLETADNVLLAVAYVPLQQKRKNIPPLQIGNNLTRNMLLKFDGAQQMTGITVDASTWQHDFTVRLSGIDQRERQSNRDIYGRALFVGDGLAVERSFGVFQLKPGQQHGMAGQALWLRAEQVEVGLDHGTAHVQGLRHCIPACAIEKKEPRHQGEEHRGSRGESFTSGSRWPGSRCPAG